MKAKTGIIILLFFVCVKSWSIGYLTANLQPGPYSLSSNGINTQYLVTTLGLEMGLYLPYFSRSQTSMALAYELGQGLNRGNDSTFQESLAAQNLALRLQSQFDKWLIGLGLNQRQVRLTSINLPNSSSQTNYQGLTPELVLAYKLGSELLTPWIYFNYSAGTLNNELSFQSIQLGARLALDAK